MTHHPSVTGLNEDGMTYIQMHLIGWPICSVADIMRHPNGRQTLLYETVFSSVPLEVFFIISSNQVLKDILGNSTNIVPSVTFYFMSNSISDISRKCILPNMIRAVNLSQFTPKMKANAVSRLLSSVVWIDQYHEYKRLTAPIIFGKNALPANIRN